MLEKANAVASLQNRSMPPRPSVYLSQGMQGSEQASGEKKGEVLL